MSNVMEYLRRYQPVQEFERRDSSSASDVVFPKSNDEEDERLADLIDKNILNLYHRTYRIGSMPRLWPPEIMEEIDETDGGGNPSHEKLKYEAVWLGNIHFAVQTWDFENQYSPQSRTKYDVKLGGGLFVEVGDFGIESRGKPYRVFDLRDVCQSRTSHEWSRSRIYGDRVSRLMVIPYPDRTREVRTGDELDVYLLERGLNYYDTPVVGEE